MVTLIIQRLGGSRTRTCSSKCYNAKHPKCICICGGVNHGIGYNKALENTHVIAQALQKQVSEDGGVRVKLPAIKEPVPTEMYSYSSKRT